MTDITDNSLFENSKISLFSTPFKCRSNDDEIINIFDEPIKMKPKIKPKDAIDTPIEEKLSHDELLMLEIKKDKEYEERQRQKRWKQINKQKEIEDSTLKRLEEIRLKKINNEFKQKHIESESKEKYQLCCKCKLTMYINETNFNKLKKTDDDYKRGWRYGKICNSCKTKETEYFKEKYEDKIKFEYKDCKCDCGEIYKVNKDKRQSYKEIERHEKSKHHKLYKMVSDYQNHLTTNIDFNLFSIGQLRAINSYKLNIKEDMKYIVINMRIKKKEIIVKELEAYDKPIHIPDNILTISK